MGCFAPGVAGDDGTVCVCVCVRKSVCVCVLKRQRVCFSLGRDLSTAGLGVVGVTGLESDLVYTIQT